MTALNDLPFGPEIKEEEKVKQWTLYAMTPKDKNMDENETNASGQKKSAAPNEDFGKNIPRGMKRHAREAEDGEEEQETEERAAGPPSTAEPVPARPQRPAKKQPQNVPAISISSQDGKSQTNSSHVTLADIFALQGRDKNGDPDPNAAAPTSELFSLCAAPHSY